MEPVAEPSRTIQPNSLAETTPSRDGPPSTPTGVQYFKLRQQLRQQRPTLLDPQLIRQRLPEIVHPIGFKRRRQVSAVPTTTVVVTSTVLVPPPSHTVTATDIVDVLPPVISVIPPVVTTIQDQNGGHSTTIITLRPPVTTTLVPVTTLTFANPGDDSTTTTTLFTVTASEFLPTPQPTGSSPEPPNNNPFPAAPFTPQARISANHVPVIVGSVIGSVAAVLFLLLAIFFFRRRRNRMRDQEPVLLPDPFLAQNRQPVFIDQRGPVSSSSLPLGATAITAHQLQPSTDQSSSKFSNTRQNTFQSQSTGIQSQENVLPRAGPSTTPSPPPRSQNSAISELTALRQRMQEIEALARNVVRETDAEIANVQRGNTERASESPPEYTSPVREPENPDSQ